jgi:hypothetical protein
VRFILRRFVYFVAGFFGLMVYQALRPYPFAIDVALCVGFTVEVAGLVVSARLFAAPPLKPLPPAGKIALTHLGFLAGVVVIERIYPLLQMLFPGGPTTRSGRPGSWALLIEVIAITLLGYGERVLLLRGPKAVKTGLWADTAIGSPVVPAGQVASGPIAAAATGAMAAPVRSAATVGTLSPELGSTGYQSVTGLFSDGGQPAQVAQPVYVPMAAVAAQAAPVTQNPMAAPVRSSSGYASITGLVAAGPEAGGASSTPGGTAQLASTGNDYEGFLTHMKEGKRPFRKPGMTVNDEFQAWLADRARGARGVPEKQSGFGRFLQGNSRA